MQLMLNNFINRCNFDFLKHGIKHLQLKIQNQMGIIPREKIKSKPLMQKPKCGMMDVVGIGLEFSHNVLSRDQVPETMTIITREGKIQIDRAARIKA